MMSRLLVPVLCAATLAACDSSDREVALRFAPVVGDQPFACGKDFDGVGSGASTVTPLDFRIYLHEVALLRSSGERVPVAIRDDGQWQSDGLVLLDFEDGSGACMTGSPGTNFEVRGSVPDHGDYVGVEFIVGVPHEQNHLDGAIAPAPLNAQGMWWTWQGGYKYVRLDMRPATQPEFFYHLGATNCAGSVQDGFECAFANLAPVRIDGFDPERDAIVVDAAKILAGVDVDHVPDGVSDTLPGCMAFAGDPECPAMMAPLGLRFEDNASAGTQTVFSVRAQGGE